MQVRIYNGEHFERGIVWQILAGIVFLGLLAITLFGSQYLGANDTWVPSWTDVLSAILFLAMFVAYRWYVRKDIERVVIAEITETGLMIDTRFYQWHAVQGFSMEKKRETGDLYSIVFILNQQHKVHTVCDDQDTIIAFARVLQEYTPFVAEIPFTKFERLLRRCKL